MTALRFVDTNILIYAATGKRPYPEKHRRARDILANERICLSTQVVQEFYVNALRDRISPLSPWAALAWVSRLERMPFVQTDFQLIKAAIGLSERYLIAYWDAAILAAAERLGAEVVYTEDLNHGQVYGTVRVENPFVTA